MKRIVLAATVASLLLMSPAFAMRFISHRGESMIAPENTMAAFRMAVENGADGCECDIYLTKDNEIVILHDGTAKRTGGLDVKPRDATLAELQALDTGTWKGPQFKGERMPSLAEYLKLAHDGFELYVEIKCGTEILPRLAEVMAAEPRATPERMVFIAFSEKVIAAVRKQFPAYRAYWLTGTGPNKDGTPGPTAEALVAKAKACNASAVSAMDSADITPAFVSTVKAAGLGFHIWTVDRAPRARELAAMGVESVTSNCGSALKAILNSVRDDRPVIHWALDGGALNSGTGGARYDAVVQGMAEYVDGKRGQGLRLDGKGNGIASVPYQLPVQGTVALWFKPESFYNFNTVFDTDGHPDQWEMWVTQDGKLRFRLAGGSGDLACDLNALGGADKWYHLAVTWDCVDTATAMLYVDGVERAAGPVRWVMPGGTFHVGGGNPGNVKGCGIVDDVRIYRTPLGDDDLR